MKDKKENDMDVRVVERYIREGVIKKEDYKEQLRILPDVTDKGCPLNIDEEEVKETEHKLEDKTEERE